MDSKILVEKHIYKKSNADFKELDELCFLSKNLYNATLFRVREHYFNKNEYLDYYKINKEFTQYNQVDYRKLPAKVSKQTQMLVHQNFKSFFALLKMKTQNKYNKRVKLPKYLDKVKGRQSVFYEKGAISFKNDGVIKLSKTNITIKTKINKDIIQFARIIPKGSHIVIEIGYRVTLIDSKPDNNRYASVDLGLNNLMAISSNVMQPYLVNGRPLKSINQYYNKKVSKYKHILMKSNNLYKSKRLDNLSLKRKNKIEDYLHKVSRKLVNLLVSNQINTLIIGCNKEWKQNINLGSINNQNFVTIPYTKLIQMLDYKCKLVGIKLELQEESYTSKCSFIDNESVEKHEKYVGKRIKRGLFLTKNGLTINADINGSLNILRKYLSKNVIWNTEILVDCIKACSKPILALR